MGAFISNPTSPEQYLRPLVHLFEASRNPDEAVGMQQYMRNQFRFLGIKAGPRRALLAEFLRSYGTPPSTLVHPTVRALWHMPHREYQYSGVDLLIRLVHTLDSAFVGPCQELITTKSWWDTVDGLASSVVGQLFRRYPETRDEWVDRWRSSDDIWLRRTAILFQLKYGEDTDWSLLTALAQENADSTEFFIQKAVGWSLRQYSKFHPERVVRFVNEAAIPPLSKREALKWLNSRGAAALRTEPNASR